MPLTSHHQRLLTAAVLVPLLLAVVFLGGWPFFAAVALFALAGQWECYSLLLPSRETLPWRLAGLACGAAALTAAWLDRPEWLVGSVLACFWLGNLDFLAEHLRRDDRAPAYQRAGALTAGLLYLPLTLQFFLRFTPEETLFVLGAAFLSDTGAYYAGVNFGRRRIWPRVSPNKTWEGSLGGLAACLAACLAYGLVFGQAPAPVWLLLGLLLNVAAQLGDFFESALKRFAGSKDSGRLLPGHGGVLDRIDALLAVTLVYAAFRTAYRVF